MIRRTTGTFRGGLSPFNANVLDVIYKNAAPVRTYAQFTQGATLLDELSSVFPPTVEKCDLLAFTVSAELVLWANETGQPEDQPYGKLGKIVTGLTQVGSKTSGVFSPANPVIVPWTQKCQPLPSDLTLLSDLWNPVNDELPPTTNTFGARPQGLKVSATQTLANPIPLFQGTNVLIGMWALPSLLRCSVNTDLPIVYPICYEGSYSLTYDDDGT